MSEQQQPEEVRARIKGYRQLSDEEQGIINEIKELAETVGNVVEAVKSMQGIDQRWAAIGATHLQEGFMALIRSIAKPTTF